MIGICSSPGFINRSNSTLAYSFFPSMSFKSVVTLTVDGVAFSPSDSNYSTLSGSMSWSNSGLTWAVGDTFAVSLKAFIPNKPGSISATAGNGEVALAWDNPSDTTITKYQYRQKEGSGSFGGWKNDPQQRGNHRRPYRDRARQRHHVRV